MLFYNSNFIIKKTKMKKTIMFFSVAVAMAGFSTAAYAQETATATATATILTPISITKEVDMNFGNVAVQSASGGTVILTPAGVRSITGGVTLPVISGTTTAASFIVNGQGNYTYAVTLPSSAVTLNDGASNTMTVTAFTSNPSGTAGVLTSGTQTLNVGATLNVSAAQNAGTYVSATPFNVTVNYN
jgi:hypothetical protein